MRKRKIKYFDQKKWFKSAGNYFGELYAERLLLAHAQCDLSNLRKLKTKIKRAIDVYGLNNEKKIQL